MRAKRKKPKRNSTERIRLSRTEKKMLKEEYEKEKRGLEERSRELLDEIIETSVEMEEYSRDPEKLMELREKKEKLEFEYDTLLEKLVCVEKYGLPLTNPLLQEVLSKRIGSEFVPKKETGFSDIETRLLFYDASIYDLKQKMKEEPGNTLLKEKIKYFEKRKKNLIRAMQKEKERKSEA